MTLRETLELLEMRQILWPNTPPPGDVETEAKVWQALLGDFDLATVAEAMRQAASEPFAPTLGQLRERISPTPTYADALAEFRQMHARGYSSHRWSLVPWSHPLIAAFAERHFAEWGASPDGASDPGLVQSEAAFRAHMRESYSGVQRRFAAGEISAGTYGRAITDGHGEVDHGSHLSLVRGSGTVGSEREDRQADPAESEPDDA